PICSPLIDLITCPTRRSSDLSSTHIRRESPIIMPIKEYFFSIRKYSERDNRCEHQLLKKMPLLLNRLKMTVSFYNPCFIFNCLHSINIVINRCELCNIKCPFPIQKRRETMMILVSMFYLIHFLKRPHHP